MFDYLQQFNRLPKELRDAVSSSEAMKALDETESNHGVRLASAVMRLMVKDLTLDKLPLFLASEFSLNEEEARQITTELKNGALKKAASYLGFAPLVSADTFDLRIAEILKTGAVSFASQSLVDRFKIIAKTYLRGVRNKIDTRLVMQKSVEAGGLGLAAGKADEIFLLLDGASSEKMPAKKSSPLDTLIAKETVHAEYNLAAAIEARKKKLLAEKELPAQPEEKDFPLEEKQKDLPLPETKAPAGQNNIPHNLPFIQVERKKEAAVVAEPDEIAAFLKKISVSDEAAPVSAPEKKPEPIQETAPAAPAVPPVSVAPMVPKKEGLQIKVNQAPKINIPDVPSAPAKIVAATATVNEKPADFQPIPTSHLVTPPRPAMPVGPKIAPVAPAGEQSRVRMDDVRVAPTVMGPIEELRFLDLVNFRRLAPTPVEATNKILAKIKLLEKSGYDRMTAGIAAWRQSETNRVYLKMCRESAFKSKPLSAIIANCLAQKEDCLNQEEIDAVMSLNAKLLF